jgi:glutathione-specific gamma-glutamylcyclotransferase
MGGMTSTPPLRLTREVILGDSIRAMVEAIDPDAPLLSEDEHRASLETLFAERPDKGDVWVFAYGSLMWNPLIHYVETRLGLVRGHHRCFCLWSRIGRGTAQKPGLTLALERGGSCRGVLYRVAESIAAQELQILWRREMLTGAYAPRWLKVSTGEGPVHALAFLINRAHVRYAGKLPEERVITAIAEAHGPLGACATYLFNTVAHLEELGIRERKLARLRDLVRERIEQARVDVGSGAAGTF